MTDITLERQIADAKAERQTYDDAIQRLQQRVSAATAELETLRQQLPQQLADAALAQQDGSLAQPILRQLELQAVLAHHAEAQRLLTAKKSPLDGRLHHLRLDQRERDQAARETRIKQAANAVRTAGTTQSRAIWDRVRERLPQDSVGFTELCKLMGWNDDPRRGR